jgi:ABC-2 type transport system permease protein
VSQFLGVVRHEFNMSIRRKGLWIAMGLLFAFFGVALLTPGQSGPAAALDSTVPWREAGETVYLFNMLAPLVAGILAADRMQRDVRYGVRELQLSAPVSRITFILGKYLGVLLSVLLPMLVGIVVMDVLMVALGQARPEFMLASLVAFLAVNIPSFAFVVAFSLACPLIMPLRVYQILFTGYWFWGNFLNSKVFPTISDTLLNSSGIYALQGFFKGQISKTTEALHTPFEAVLNLLVLGSCVAAVLFVLDRYFAWQARRA